MSHVATTWAIQQRGLKPPAKVVLWHLCDRFHPDHGCFPSQKTLAHDCEMSRSTLNVHLAALEERKLIRREQKRDPATKRQTITRYRLAFEANFEAAEAVQPCPEPGPGFTSRERKIETHVRQRGQGAKSKQSHKELSPEKHQSRVGIAGLIVGAKPVNEPVNNPPPPPVEAPRSTDRKINPQQVEEQFRRVFSPWPHFAIASKFKAMKRWLTLTEVERQQAAEAVPRYLATVISAKRYAVSIATFLDQRDLWIAAPPEPNDYAPPFGQVWAAWRLWHLITVPAGPTGWPYVQKMDERAKVRRGLRFGDRWHRPEIGALMEAVRVNSPEYERWRLHHEQHGWPWLPDPGDLAAVYFPRGGPNGLTSFAEALRQGSEGASGGRRGMKDGINVGQTGVEAPRLSFGNSEEGSGIRWTDAA